MELIELLACEGLEASPPSSYCSLFRVLLFNIQTGLSHDHVDAGVAHDVFVELLYGLEDADSSPHPLHVDWVYGKLSAILAGSDPARFFSRRQKITSHLGAQPVSCQPSWRLKDWLRGVPEVRNEVHSAGDVETGIREFMKEESRVPEAKVGDPLLWLTPYSGVVAELLNAARQDYLDSGIGGLDRLHYAQRLRDLLGIQRRHHPDRTIAVVLHNSIGRLQAAATKSARSARSVPALPRLAAPTQFDAGDYPRFRHWPAGDAADEGDYGRTWDLDDETDADEMRGAPELVSEPISLEGARLFPLGQIRSHAPTEDEAIKLDFAFAEHVCGLSTIGSLIPDLARRLRV